MKGGCFICLHIIFPDLELRLMTHLVSWGIRKWGFSIDILVFSMLIFPANQTFIYQYFLNTSNMKKETKSFLFKKQTHRQGMLHECAFLETLAIIPWSLITFPDISENY